MIRLKVLPKAGAFIDGFFFAQDEIIEYTPKGATDTYQWGQPVDINGNPIGEQKNPDAIGDKIAEAFGKKGAESTTAPAQTFTDTTKTEQIKQALGLLEAGNDAHWNAKGEPTVEVVSNIIGVQVTRAEIKAAAPDFTRPKE